MLGRGTKKKIKKVKLFSAKPVYLSILVEDFNIMLVTEVYP